MEALVSSASDLVVAPRIATFPGISFQQYPSLQ